MGIDVYMSWIGQTAEEKQAQIDCGFSPSFGKVGYLREAYHGGPYATRVLIPEGFDATYEGVEVAPDLLESRAEGVVMACIERAKAQYGEELKPTDPRVRSFIDFINLYREKYDAGLRPNIRVSW